MLSGESGSSDVTQERLQGTGPGAQAGSNADSRERRYQPGRGSECVLGPRGHSWNGRATSATDSRLSPASLLRMIKSQQVLFLGIWKTE